MIIIPAIDLYGGKAVRLIRGDYSKMTVYSDDPVSVAAGFKAAGARYLHVVDLEGARDGNTPNFDTIIRIIKTSGLKTEVGGGIRSAETVRKYLNAGAFRVILGTAAVTDPELLTCLAKEYGDRIAVGADIKDGMIAVKGWTEVSGLSCIELVSRLRNSGISCVICTDISRDGLMSGTNLGLYKELSEIPGLSVIASGGITGTVEIKALANMGIYGSILGKALYAGALTLPEALAAAEV